MLGLEKIFQYWSTDMAIDLGTANTLVFVKGRGIVLNEPSVVAIIDDKGKKSVLAVGDEAKTMLGRTPGNISAVRPLRDGVIADFIVTEEMIKHFIKKVHKKKAFANPRILICVPTGSTPVERKAIQDSALAAGARKVNLIEESIAAAIGAGLPISEATGSMVVDIGGGTTDVAVFMDDNCWNIEVLPAGGMQVTSDISRGLRLPMKVSEDIKLRHGRVDRAAMEDDSLIDVPGFDRGAPIAIRRRDLAMVIEARMAEILERVRDSVNSNGFHDLLPAGVVLTGGGSQLQGLIGLANDIIELPVTLGRPPALWGLDDEVRQPEFCTGIGLMLAGLEARAGTGWLAPVPTGLQAIFSNIQEWGLKLLSPKPGWEPDS